MPKLSQKDFFSTLCDKILKKNPFVSLFVRDVYFQESKLKKYRLTFHRKPTNYSIIVCHCHRPLRWLHGPTCTKQIRSGLHRYETRVNVEPLYLEIPFPYSASRISTIDATFIPLLIPSLSLSMKINRFNKNN